MSKPERVAVAAGGALTDRRLKVEPAKSRVLGDLLTLFDLWGMRICTTDDGIRILADGEEVFAGTLCSDDDYGALHKALTE